MAYGDAVVAAPISLVKLQDVNAAVRLVGIALFEVQKLHLDPTAVLSLASSIGLLLGAGRSCLADFPDDWPATLLSDALLIHMGTMSRLLDAAEDADVRSQLASVCAAPHAMKAWLSTAAAATDRVADPGE